MPGYATACLILAYVSMQRALLGLRQCKTMEVFTKNEIEQAELPHVVQRQMGHPTDERTKNIVSQRGLKNTPIRISDIANAKTLFGTSVPGLKGWTTRKKVKGGFPVDRVSIPAKFYRLNKFVTIAADVMFVSVVPFFVTYSRKIKFLTVEYLPRRTAGQLANALRKVIFFYMHVGVLLFDTR